MEKKISSVIQLKNYPDNKCKWGYMTLCQDCISKAPRWVDVNNPIEDYFPSDRCEECEKKGKVFFKPRGENEWRSL